MKKTSMGWCAYTTLLVGVLFLLRDLNIWDFWNIQWWTVVFLLMGLSGVMCKGCCEAPKGKKK